MKFNRNWEIVEENYGEGGQGKVHKVRRKSPEHDLVVAFSSIVDRNVLPHTGAVQRKAEEIVPPLREYIKSVSSSEICALKVLHQPKDARDPELAPERMKREIKAMSKITHPNLLKVREYDVDDSQWFVAEFYAHGTLHGNLALYKGKALDSLIALRPMVEGVAKLHSNEIVHRDIKPENIFIGNNGELILGDFGLVYFADEQKIRLSGTIDNVGSWDWMPQWAQRVRIEDIKPTFDVYSLGKVLWAMVSGSEQPLNREYWNQSENDLTELFSNSPEMSQINEILAKCVVEYENEKVMHGDAYLLLKQMDQIIRSLEIPFTFKGSKVNRPCLVCGIGKYILKADGGKTEAMKFGFDPTHGGDHRLIKIFTCDNCGHVQWFQWLKGEEPKAWQTK